MHAIADRTATIVDKPLEAQFEALILQPLLAHVLDGPLVFLVHGVDSFLGCAHGHETAGKFKERQEMAMRVLQVLVEGSARFPSNVRLLISSQENEGVRELLGGFPKARVVQLELVVAPLVS